MSEEITAPYHSYENLRRRADELLAKHHPAGTIPVRIEEIVAHAAGPGTPSEN